MIRSFRDADTEELFHRLASRRCSGIARVALRKIAIASQATGRTVQACEASVEQRIMRDGFRRVDFASARADDRPGRNDFVIGTASALERDRPVWFDFSCSVDLRAGTVRSADVTPRR